MRTALAGLTLFTFINAASTQEPLQILTPKDEPRKMLYKFLQGEAQKHFDARKKLVASLDTPEKIYKRQAELKAKFIESIGGFPKKSPLNANVVGTVKGDGFIVDKVI